MISKIYRLLILIIGSFFSLCIITFLSFAEVYTIENIKDTIDNLKEFKNVSIQEILGGLAINLYVVAVIIAWFNSKIGGFLITFFGIAQIILWPIDTMLWFQAMLLLVGPPLLIYVYYNKWILKKKGNSA